MQEKKFPLLEKVGDYLVDGFHLPGLFVIGGIMMALLAIWTGWRMGIHRVPREFFEPFLNLPRTSHNVIELLSGEEEASDDSLHVGRDTTT